MAVHPIGPYLEPLRKRVAVPCSPAEAFELFTARIAEWWPLAGYSVYGDRAQSCGIEPRVGGDIFEVGPGGARAVWGRVTHWEPPRRLQFMWFPGRTQDTAQTVEVRFLDANGGTSVELEHRDWQTLGDRAPGTRRGYDGGWNEVLARFEARASARS